MLQLRMQVVEYMLVPTVQAPRPTTCFSYTEFTGMMGQTFARTF